MCDVNPDFSENEAANRRWLQWLDLIGDSVLFVGVFSIGFYECLSHVFGFFGEAEFLVEPLPSLPDQLICASSSLEFGSVARGKIISVQVLRQLLA